MNNISIRRAEISDIDQIMSIESVAFGTHHWSYESFYTEITNNYSKYFVAELQNDQPLIIGYIGYWLLQEEGHITTLAVMCFFREIGVADILLYNLIQNAIKSKIKWLTLEVRASNVAALNLYKKYNFKVLGIRKKYYQDNNEDGLILWTNNIQDLEYIELLRGKEFVYYEIV